MTLSLPSFTRSWLPAVSLLLLLLGTSLLAQAQSNATPAIRYVRTDGTNASPAAATSWATSTTDLQGAINASAAGDQVWVATGTYKPGGNANTDINISFSMKNEVSILGGFPATGSPTLTERNPTSLTTVLSGDIGEVGNGTPSIGNVSDNSYHVINNSGLNMTAVLDGFVIRDGYASYYGFSTSQGGGMYNENSSPTLTNCRFIANRAYRNGGGIHNTGSSPTLTNCSFVDNTGRFGGAMDNYNSSPTLTNCRFMDNRSAVGGGMRNIGSSPTLTNCSFVGNSAGATGSGGGMSNDNSSPVLTNCSFVGNSAGYGGGIYIPGSSSTLTNCSFVGNSAQVYGGAMYYSGSSVLTNCVLFSNGGANTLYTNNNSRVTATYSLFEDGVTGYDGENNLTTTVSPFLSPTDTRLNGCSSAINTGLNSANSTTTDPDGNPRFVNTTIDRGAYEFQGQPNFPTAITQQPPSGSLVCQGSTVSIPLSVSGTGSFTYQLVTATGTPVGPSQSTTPLTLVNVQPAQSGSYSVIVTGSCNSVTSTAFSLTVNTPTAPTLAANPSTTTTNQPITVTANGCPGGTINWTALGGSGQAIGTTYTVTQPGNYTLSATCSLNGCTSPPSSALSLQIRPGGFAITSVNMVNCQLSNAAKGEYFVNFTPQFSGANANPITFAVVNELSPTTAPAPYTLRLYTDNPVITLVANQAGNAETRYAYHWLASCQSGSSPNRPPTTTGIPNHTILQGQAYQLNLSSYFSDPDGQPLTYQAQGLPAGLSLSGSVISGAPTTTGVSGITITVLDPGNLSASASFQLTVNPALTTPTGFAIVGVSTVNCEALSAGLRRLTFTPQYSGVSGQPISFSVVNELLPTTAPGPYTLRLYTDNPLITLKATQSGTAGEASFSYNWLAACNTGSGARLEAEPVSELQVVVLGNPVVGETVEVEVRGAQGQPLRLQLRDERGHQVSEQSVGRAGVVERHRLHLGQTPAGMLLLRVSTSTQSQTVKLIKAE